MGNSISWCWTGQEDLTCVVSSSWKDGREHSKPGRNPGTTNARIINRPRGVDTTNVDVGKLKDAIFTSGDFHTKYNLKNLLGTGSTCVCHLCSIRQCPNAKPQEEAHFACKVVELRSNNPAMAPQNLLNQYKIEIQILQSLSHPNIIHLQDAFHTESKIYVITELMQGGELFDYIIEKGTLSEREASEIVFGVTSALAYMHSCGVVHRDLKPENLLLSTKGQGSLVKIIDFGLAKILTSESETTRSFLGTRGYLAPEILQRQAYKKSVDVWALGVIVFVLLCGCLPFDNDGSKTSNEVVTSNFNLRFPKWASDLSDSAKDLLRHLLTVDSTKRYTAEEALAHPWVAGTNVSSNRLLQSPKHLRQRGTPNWPRKKTTPSQVIHDSRNKKPHQQYEKKKKKMKVHDNESDETRFTRSTSMSG